MIFEIKQLKKTLSVNIPAEPGVYIFRDSLGTPVYVGKSKILRRRLSQYFRAKRIKKHLKMRRILKGAHTVELQVCSSPLDADLHEIRLIQELRPKWNTASAFYFLYPMIGLRRSQGGLSFCYTTNPESFRDYDFHGAFRSRWITREAFFSLKKLLVFVGHQDRGPAGRLPKYSYSYRFRQLPEQWFDLWTLFLKGESPSALSELSLALVENAAARCRSKEIQQDLNQIKMFWDLEAKRLYQARTRVPIFPYPVPQKDRDLLFQKYKSTIAP